MSKSWQSIRTMIERTATAKGRAASGCFSIEGTRLHERALRAGVYPKAVLVSEAVWQTPGERETAVLHHLTQHNVRLHAIPNDEMTRRSLPQGLLPTGNAAVIASFMQDISFGICAQ